MPTPRHIKPTTDPRHPPRADHAVQPPQIRRATPWCCAALSSAAASGAQRNSPRLPCSPDLDGRDIIKPPPIRKSDVQRRCKIGEATDIGWPSFTWGRRPEALLRRGYIALVRQSHGLLPSAVNAQHWTAPASSARMEPLPGRGSLYCPHGHVRNCEEYDKQKVYYAITTKCSSGWAASLHANYSCVIIHISAACRWEDCYMLHLLILGAYRYICHIFIMNMMRCI